MKSKEPKRAAQQTSTKVIPNPTDSPEPASVTDPSTNPEDRIFYGEVEVISQSEAKGECPALHQRVEELEQGVQAHLEDEKLRIDAASLEKSRGILQLRFVGMGFDTFRYQASVGDQGLPRNWSLIPFQIRPRPGNQVEFEFLDQKVILNPEVTPIYSFSVDENRGPCRILHNVNIFFENMGSRERAKSKSP